MMNRIRILAATAFLFSTGPALAEGWLCVAEKATGFKLSPGQGWDYSLFNADGKYVITRPERRSTLFPDTVWIIFELGQQTPSFYCDQDFIEDQLKCTFFREFAFNRSALRYTLVQYGDYLMGEETDPEAATPYLEIGKCSPL